MDQRRVRRRAVHVLRPDDAQRRARATSSPSTTATGAAGRARRRPAAADRRPLRAASPAPRTSASCPRARSARSRSSTATAPATTPLHVLPGYGHLDVFLGQDAAARRLPPDPRGAATDGPSRRRQRRRQRRPPRPGRRHPVRPAGQLARTPRPSWPPSPSTATPAARAPARQRAPPGPPARTAGALLSSPSSTTGRPTSASTSSSASPSPAPTAARPWPMRARRRCSLKWSGLGPVRLGPARQQPDLGEGRQGDLGDAEAPGQPRLPGRRQHRCRASTTSTASSACASRSTVPTGCKVPLRNVEGRSTTASSAAC